MKKILVILSLVLFVSSFMFAGGRQATTDARQEITFWTMSLSPAFDDYLNNVISSFETQNPNVRVNWVDVPWGDTETRVLTAAASGTLPDVINLNLPFSQRLAQNELLINMNQAATDVRNNFFQGTWEASTYNSTVFGLPWYITSNMIFYNKDIFRQAGLDPNRPPTTFDELYEFARAIRQATGAYGYMTFFQDQFIMEELERMGIRLFNQDFTQARFNTPEVIEAAAFYGRMLRENLIPSETITARSGTGEAIQLFSAGQLAMFLGGTSHARMIRENSQTIYDNMGVGPQIRGVGGKSNIAVMNIVVPTTTSHRDASLAFAKYLTNNANQVEFAQRAGTIVPSTRAALDDPFFSVSDGSASAEARIMSAQEVSQGTVIFPPIQNWPEIRDAFLEAFARAVTGQGDAATVLRAAENTANQLLN